MNLRRALFIAALAATPALPAAAQTPFPPAGQTTPFPPAGQNTFSGAAPQQQFQPPQQQEPPCVKQFEKLRDEAATRAKRIEAASKAKQKPSPKVVCGLFNSFSSAEAKMIKFAVENQTWCGIPPQVIDQMKKGHARTSATRTRICQIAAAPPRPRGPSLSEALGATAPSAGNIKTGHGTFDTLTGTPLGER